MATRPKYLLLPRKSPVYGQDYLCEDIRLQLGLKPIYTGPDDRYDYVVSPQDAALVVSQNPDNLSDAILFEQIHHDLTKLMHVHLQLRYLDPSAVDNLSRVARVSKYGVSPADFHKRMLEERYGSTIWSTIYNGCDQKKFFPSSEQQRLEFRKKYNICEGKIVVACVGRLDDTKGLQIIRELARRAKDDLCLVLQYPYSDSNIFTHKFRRFATEIKNECPNVVRTIEDDRSTDDKYMRYADCLLSPSLCEVAPMVVVEALMCGVPVLATGSTPFFVDDLRRLHLPENALRVMELPDRIQTLDRLSLRLHDDEINQLVELSMSHILAYREGGSDHERNMLAATMCATEFTQEAMLNKISELYEKAAAQC